MIYILFNCNQQQQQQQNLKTAVMESQYFLKYRTKISLSEQQLVDCTYNSVSGNFGCNGGWTDKCLRYANVTGVVSTSQYPYNTSVSYI